MDTKDAISDLWRICFGDSEEYRQMYFTHVYREEDALWTEEEGRLASSLLLQGHTMDFHGAALPVSYLCGAATHPSLRGRGLMTALMRRALQACHGRGDMACALIPAHGWLYGFYRRFGFSPAFGICLERYTSAHPFTHSGTFADTGNPESPGAYAFFSREMGARPACIQHTPRQYRQILLDNGADGGTVTVMADHTGEIRSMAFAVSHGGEVTVKDVLAADEDARLAALQRVHDMYPGEPVTVYGYHTAPAGIYRRRGMIRITDVRKCLEAIAASHPGLKLTIRLRDSVIPENDGIWTMRRGEVEEGSVATRRPDYDITPEVLASIVFGDSVTRRLLDFPSVSPFMSLMLD